MTNEYDIDTPANMELLGGTDIDEPVVDETPADQPVVDDGPVETPAEVVAEEVVDEDPAPAKRDPVIPRARFDEVNAKLHAEREEVERLRAELNARTTADTVTPDVIDVDELEDAYFEAILEGDKARAKEIRATINSEIYAKAEAASTAAVSRQLTEREVQVSFANTVSQTITDYPFLDSNSAEANPDAIADVVEWRDLYISKGDSPAVALQKAAAKVAPLYASKPETVVEPAPSVDQRKQKALAAAANAAANQPPRVDAGVGNRAIPVGDSIISDQNKWEKASDAERLRYLQ